MNEAEKKYQESIERGAEALAKEIDQEVMETILRKSVLRSSQLIHAGQLMSDKGYELGDLKDIPKRWLNYRMMM